MVRPRLVTRTLLPLLLAALPTVARAQGPRPFDSLLPAANAAAPGTYAVNGALLVPVPEGGPQIPVLLQADVIRGAERAARVGVVVAADVPRAALVRLVVATAAKGAAAGAVVADAGGAGAAGPLRLVREVSLEPGDYELRAIVGESRDGTGLVSVARSRLSVPDLRAGGLVATPVVLGEAASAGAAELKPRLSVPDLRAGGLVATPVVLGEAASAGAAELKPFVFGKTTLTPSLASRVAQGGSVSVAFRVYNWSVEGGEKPDLSVEYLFYERGTRGLHFFNKVKPQQLNADTLGPSYDPSSGSVAAGMTIPLAAFTFGDFELLVRVTDNRAHQSVEQRAAFTVVP
jgi:hypothetical protein